MKTGMGILLMVTLIMAATYGSAWQTTNMPGEAAFSRRKQFSKFPQAESRVAHSPQALSLAASNDGRFAAASFSDGSICVWDATTKKKSWHICAHRLEKEPHEAAANCVAFNPDGKTLVSGGQEQRVRFWDLTTGKEIASFVADSEYVSSLTFSPDGTRMFTAGSKVKLWSVTNKELMQTFDGHGTRALSAALSLDKTLVLGVSDRRNVNLWNVASGKVLWSHDDDHVWEVHAVAFSPDSKCALALDQS